MCLPIKTQDEIHGFFDGQDKEFIGMIRDGGEYIKKHANYCHIWTNTPLYRTCKPVKAISRGLVEVQKLLGIDRLRKENLTVSTGWTWFSVTDGHCRYLLENREFIHRIFRNTLASDEMFMGTMVVNFGLEDRLYDITGVDCYDYTVGSKRLIDWERGKPYVWGQETPEEDFAELMSSHCMFARKFDERINFEIIQRIYDTLKNR